MRHLCNQSFVEYVDAMADYERDRDSAASVSEPTAPALRGCGLPNRATGGTVMKAKFKVGSKVKILRKPQMKSVVKTVDRVAPREYMYTVEDTYPTWYRECELELAKEAK